MSEIYIDCQPVGTNDEKIVIKKKKVIEFFAFTLKMMVSPARTKKPLNQNPFSEPQKVGPNSLCLCKSINQNAVPFGYCDTDCM